MHEGAATHPQVVERVGGRLPVPPARLRARTAVNEVGAAGGPPLADRLLDRSQGPAILLEPAGPATAARVIVEHRAPPGREVICGHETRSVGPVFEERATLVDETIQRSFLVDAE